METNKKIKFLCEFIPLLAFFVVFRIFDIIAATAIIVVLTVISTAVNYVVNKELSAMNIISVSMIIIFGSITVFSKDATFIKIKPTIINLVFAAIISFGIARKQLYLKKLLSKSITLPDKNWLSLSKRFILFFISLACLNEVIWRNFSDATWVSFKAFGVTILILLFMLCQIPYIKKYSVVTKTLE